MRSFLLLTFLLAGTTYLSAQNSGSIKGKLVDSSGKQNLALATITVFKAKDTTIVTYRLSDPQGDFKVPGLPFNIPLRAVISFSGYKVVRKEFELTQQEASVDLGTIKMLNDAQSLDEVLVVAERPPVSVKKDTIEFNASAFKTLPTALVEDLLKKMPGLDIDKDGNISMNGRAVNRILVDGKEFFGGDPKIATRNLPANIVDKVQISDDKDQLDQNPDIPKSQLGQVINLKLKRSIKQGWFGKAYAGAGTDDRYEAGAIANMFRDTLQVSLLGFTNNLNKAGFGLSDIMNTGGFNRSGFNSVAMTSDGGYALNGISFGGMGQGIVRTSGGGINLNNELGKKATLNLQYFYGQNNSRLSQLTNTQQFFRDTTLTTRSINQQETNDYTHRIGGSLRLKLDSFTTLRIEPQVNLKKTESERLLQTNSFSNFEPRLNESNNNQRVKGNEFGYSHNISFNRTFRKKGRTLFISNYFSIYQNDNNQYNDILDSFYKAPVSGRELYQLRDRDGDNFRTNLNVTYNEPIAKNLGLKLSNLAEVFKDEDVLDTYNREPQGKEYDVVNPDLSNGLKRSGVRNTANAGLKWTWKKWTFTPGVSLLTLDIKNDFIKTPPLNQNFSFLLPTMNINFKEWNFSYNVNIREPQATDLQPVVDNTNSLYQQLGNTSLVPTKSHSLYLNYYKYDTKHSANYNVYVSGSIDEDAVVRERYVDSKGVQITRPINVDGIWRFNGNFNVSKQIKMINNWQLSLRAGFWGSFNKNMVIVNSNRSMSRNYGLNPNVGITFNWRDKLELTQRYSVNYNESKYDNNAFTNLSTVTHISSSEVIVRVPKHWVWESTIDYMYNPQTAPGVRKANVRWNAGVNFLFLKEDRGQLKLSVFDLLNQNISVTRTTRENYIQDNQTSILRRYFMLTFTYNIRNFKAGKVGGRDRLFMF